MHLPFYYLGGEVCNYYTSLQVCIYRRRTESATQIPLGVGGRQENKYLFLSLYVADYGVEMPDTLSVGHKIRATINKRIQL